MGRNGFHIGKKATSGRKIKSKKDRKTELKNNILKMDPPNITEQRLMSTFNLTKSQTYFMLKTLVEEKKLRKYGRGSKAVWKKL